MGNDINFIPNDPKAGKTAPKVRQKQPRARTGGASFNFGATPAQGQFDVGTPEFLFWQCREAALAAVEAWEASVAPHKKWQGNRAKLDLLQDAGDNLNAFYDRGSVSFFHHLIGNKTYFSGASTDVVSHETGHALLDSIRPDAWDINFLEVGAFHEAFGDIIAISTALEDDETRRKLLTVTKTLRKRNFTEATAEELSDGIRRINPQHNAAKPRHAFNQLQYQLPQSLPDDGGPGELINEVHSFGMIMTGCYWDLLANLFNAASSQTGPALLAASRKALSLVVAGVQAAPITPRFFQAVGRAMVLADDAAGSTNREHIRGAFQAHGIQLGSGAMVAPSMALAGDAPKGAKLAAPTRRDLLTRLALPTGAKLSVERAELFGSRVVQVTHTREVELGAVSRKLKGVVAVTPEPVIVGSSGSRAAVVGNLPNLADTEHEVHSFVQSLLKHDRIAFTGARGRGVVASSGAPTGQATHVIVQEGGRKVLRRACFQCR